MIGERDMALVQAGIDGELDDDERERLREMLAGSPELRAYERELRELTDMLDGLPPENPPDDLHRDLLRQVEPSGQDRRHPRAGWSPFGPALRYAAAFAGGLALTAALYETASLDDSSPEELARLAGTMIYNEQPPGTTEADRLVLATEELQGDVTLHRGGDTWVVTFHLDSPAPVGVTMAFDGLPFRGFAQIEDELDEVRVTGGEMRLVTEGKREFAVFLGEGGKDGARLDLRFYAGGEQVSGGSLDASE